MLSTSERCAPALYVRVRMCSACQRLSSQHKRHGGMRDRCRKENSAISIHSLLVPWTTHFSVGLPCSISTPTDVRTLRVIECPGKCASADDHTYLSYSWCATYVATHHTYIYWNYISAANADNRRSQHPQPATNNQQPDRFLEPPAWSKTKARSSISSDQRIADCVIFPYIYVNGRHQQSIHTNTRLACSLVRTVLVGSFGL